MRIFTAFVLISVAAVVLASASASPSPQPSGDPYLDRARSLQSKYPLIDGHNDLPWQYRKYANDSILAIDISKPIAFGEFQTNLPRYHFVLRSRVSAQRDRLDNQDKQQYSTFMRESQ